MIYPVAALLAYLLGSMPWGYLAGRINGVDLRREGSGNTGATNALRVLGKKWGYLVFALDALKGVLAVKWSMDLGVYFDATGQEKIYAGVVAAIFVMVGHSYPVWLRFQGGKGIATAAGVMLALSISHSAKLVLALPVLWGTGLVFASVALVFNALAKGYDFFTYYFTLFLTPMMFLSGVFFPLEQLPTWVATMAQWLPLNHAVALVRPLFMDQWPQNVAWHAGILVAYGAIGFWVALALTRKRFRA